MKSLNGLKFAEMVQMGSHHLFQNADYVDALNVFPVPDGDTGTNMNLSMTSGAKETTAQAEEHIGKTANALSKGLLMGARGNSGVILSQLFRGFSKYIAAETELSALKFAEALQHGVETAYKAVMKPVEGTILTVAKDAAAKGMETAKTEEDIIVWFETVLAEAQASLERTPDLLPVLKEVGVVDSGGQGLVYVYEGFLASLKGEELPEKHAHNSMTDLVSAEHHKNIASFMDTADIEFGYCTEFMVKFEKGKKEFNEALFRSDLSEYGDSLLVIADDEIAKIHIHSEEPGKVLTYGQDYGSLISMKIENMRQQHIDIVGEDFQKNAPKQQTVQPYAVVTVAMGEGIADLLRSIGASYVIEGGQTMNPSTEDIVNAVKSIGAERVLILPNNKNIIMAAEQAAELLDIEAAVVPTKDVPQGMSALLAFNPDASVEDNQAAMASASKHVKSGSVTFAVRDTSIDGIEIKKDDFMGISEGKIVVSDSNLDSVTEKLAKQLVDSEAEIVTILFGEDVTAADAEKLGQFIETLNSDVEVEIHEGKQPLYPFIIAVE
ncbi:DAK2 domain-containing protein [Microbacterium sp. APC 3898]|uniref:DAK2 domain-containing protein n=2 Tax=Planococcus TaxID=1372 RepID=A0ABT7ZG39_9BACL|nr:MULTISPECIES: DAK2 domain-containing protein [Terrabacteria group]MBD8013818.1 DAK2 domain-containing protein [Planococcus wigleyi]MDN3426121.1 DAK2 domain-containing protein [Planococcus sp. APC 4016]MDN3497818.1 DAK2 domain-containing protein [Microbacterium sp. APC 3898]